MPLTGANWKHAWPGSGKTHITRCLKSLFFLHHATDVCFDLKCTIPRLVKGGEKKTGISCWNFITEFRFLWIQYLNFEAKLRKLSLQRAIENRRRDQCVQKRGAAFRRAAFHFTCPYFVFIFHFLFSLFTFVAPLLRCFPNMMVWSCTLKQAWPDGSILEPCLNLWSHPWKNLSANVSQQQRCGISHQTGLIPFFLNVWWRASSPCGLDDSAKPDLSKP